MESLQIAPLAENSSVKREYPAGTQITKEALTAIPDQLVSGTLTCLLCPLCLMIYDIDMLGNWKHNLDRYSRSFAKRRGESSPFGFAVIDGFFDEKVALELAQTAPQHDASLWQRYHNPLEIKHSCNTLSLLPEPHVRALLALNSPRCFVFRSSDVFH